MTFLSFIFCMQSCIYICRTTMPEDEDYYDTIKKYWGSTGYKLYYCGVIVILMCSTTGYFIILTQLVHKCIIYAFLKIGMTSSQNQPSESQVAVIVYLTTTTICLMKDLRVFIAICSKGAYSIIALILVFAYVATYSLSNTNFQIEWFPNDKV